MRPGRGDFQRGLLAYRQELEGLAALELEIELEGQCGRRWPQRHGRVHPGRPGTAGHAREQVAWLSREAQNRSALDPVRVGNTQPQRRAFPENLGLLELPARERGGLELAGERHRAAIEDGLVDSAAPLFGGEAGGDRPPAGKEVA